MAALSAAAFTVLVWSVSGLVLAIFVYIAYAVAADAGLV